MTREITQEKQKIESRIAYVESLQTQWYFPELNIDNVNCFGVALYVTGHIDEVKYVHPPDWVPRLEPASRKYGNLAIFGDDSLAAVCLDEEYFFKWGIGEEISRDTEEELTEIFGPPQFYKNNF